MFTHPEQRAWEQKCAERRIRNAEAFAREGIPLGRPDCRFYADGHGNPVPYGHGLTAEEWSQQIGRPSAVRAADLPED